MHIVVKSVTREYYSPYKSEAMLEAMNVGLHDLCYSCLASNTDWEEDIVISKLPFRPGPYVHGIITNAGLAEEGFSSYVISETAIGANADSAFLDFSGSRTVPSTSSAAHT